MSEFFGKDGFVWWKGVCENRQDPLKLGRYKIRAFGWHTQDKQLLPTDSLPWAQPSLPLDNGRNVVGMKEGDWCWGFFRDGSKTQEPVVVGYVPGIPEDSANPEIGFYDPTPDDKLVPGSLPRPPEYSPVAESEEDDEEADTSAFSNPNVVPGDNVAFGELAQNYVANNYKWDINGDGVYNAVDASLLISPDSDKNNEDDDFFGGDAPIEDVTYPMSRYPLKERLNEPDSSRLARNEKIEQTIVAKKKGFVASGDTASHAGIGVGSDQAHESEPFLEPATPYAAAYPYNHVYESESGHVKEIDDTPGAERLHDYHRSGTFTEVHPDGTRVVKGVKDGYNIFLGDYFMYAEKKASLSAKTDVLIKSGAFMNIQAGSDMNQIAGGNRTDEIGNDHNTRIKGNKYTIVEGDTRLLIKGDAYILVEGNLETKVEGDYLMDASGMVRISSGGPMEIKSGATLGIHAPVTTIQSDALTSIIGPACGPEMIVSAAGVANVGLVPPIAPEIPIVPVPSENDADNKDNIETTSSPKEGFIIYGPPGDLYKPFSDSTGNAVTLSATLGTPHSLFEALPTGELQTVGLQYKHVDATITAWDLIRPIHRTGSFIESGVYAGNGNGGRDHYRWSKPGTEYPKQMFLVIGDTKYLILNSGVRHESFGGTNEGF